LGIRRDQEAVYLALAQNLGMAVRVDQPGHSLLDYHTAQAPVQRKGRNIFTRRDEIRDMLEPAEQLNTILSTRRYIADAFFTVCLWIKGEVATYSLETMKKALEQPHFVLYLGRKSCPAALPLNAELIQADNLAAALQQYPVDERIQNTWRKPVHDIVVYLDRTEQAGLELEAESKVRDEVLSKQRFLFSERYEGMARIRSAATEEGEDVHQQSGT